MLTGRAAAATCRSPLFRSLSTLFMLPGRQPLGTGSWGSFYVILCCCCWCLAAIVAPLLLLLPLPFAFGCAALSLLQDDDFPQIHKVFPFVTWQRAQHNKKKTITRCMQWQRERERVDRERERGAERAKPILLQTPNPKQAKSNLHIASSQRRRS